MRMTPAQMAVHLICGRNLPGFCGPPQSLEENMKEGRAELARFTKVDYGFDLQRWHDHLKAMPMSESLGYTWNRTIALPKIMKAALASDAWRNAARKLGGGT
jgi:hypothetical protein